ncbi:MAG: pyridoxal-phosphate dependent enzyme [Bacteroidota bacterium]
MIGYTKTPIQEIKSQIFEQKGIRLIIKREDQNHPFASGNKWWKLKYNLEEALRLGYKTLLTFGGAYSNHIYATAAAAKEVGLKSIGIIRGEETMPLNHTLVFAESCGMKFQYVSREEYRKKTESGFVQKLNDRFGDFYLIPEGGTNALAVKGVAEFGKQLVNEVDFDYLCLPVGTGGTMAGIVNGFEGARKIVGFSVLKGGGFLKGEVKKYTGNGDDNWSILKDYHFGGYGKIKDELINFMKEMETNYQLPLDHVYTAKMMFGIFDLIRKDYFKNGSTILAIHTGGLQGKVSLSQLNSG